MTTATKATTYPLLERVYSESCKVDREAGVIRGVKILGSESRNGRTYSAKAMESAARLYEGSTVNVDHPDRKQPDRERGLAEGIGELRGVTVLEGGVFGDLHYLKSHPMAEQVCERAERMPGKVGLSHNAEGVVRREKGKLIVEDVERVRSVDLVGCPATNAGLFESVQEDEDESMKTVTRTIKQIVESVPAKTFGRDILEEMAEGEAAMAETPVEMPAEASSEDQVKSAFRAMVMAAFDDESLDTQATLAKIKEIMKAQEKLMSKGGDAAAAGESASTEEPAMESLEIKRLRAEMGARDLLESAGVKRKDSRIKSLLACDDEKERKELLEDWKAADLPSRPAAPRPGRSVPLTESVGSYDELTKGGFASALN